MPLPPLVLMTVPAWPPASPQHIAQLALPALVTG
jgi:hypothetical protein